MIQDAAALRSMNDNQSSANSSSPASSASASVSQPLLGHAQMNIFISPKQAARQTEDTVYTQGKEVYNNKITQMHKN